MTFVGLVSVYAGVHTKIKMPHFFTCMGSAYSQGLSIIIFAAASEIQAAMPMALLHVEIGLI